MDFAYIIILSFVSLAVLFIITKIMGFRQISEMSFFDYVIGITIGSIAAEMATILTLNGGRVYSQWLYMALLAY